VRNVPARRKGRKKNFNLNPIRRAEIIRHAIYVGAMETEDRDRWLVAWALHNFGTNQVWGVMRAAQKMGGEITEVEAIAIVDEANAIDRAWSADKLAKYLGLAYAVRQRLNVTTIGAKDVGYRARKNLRRERDLIARAAKRRAAGIRPQSESLSTTRPWEEFGMSRRSWYRNKARTTVGTTFVTASLLTADARTVPAEREEPFPSREATTMAADIYASDCWADWEPIPAPPGAWGALELEMPDNMLARAA